MVLVSIVLKLSIIEA